MDDAFREDVRKRLEGMASSENIEKGLELGDRIEAESHPDHELGVRLTKLMAPFLEGSETLEDMQYLAGIAMNAWNTALMPESEQGGFLDFMIASMMEGRDEDGFFRKLTTEMFSLKMLLYPDDLRFIGDCDVKQDGKRFIITASVGPDYMSGAAPDMQEPLGFEAMSERDVELARRMGKPIEEITLEDVQRFVTGVEARATPDPDVSERLMRIVAPLLQGNEDEHTMNLLAISAMIAWNASWRAPDFRAAYLGEAARKVANEDEVESFLQLVAMIMPHKNELFPDDERIVSDVQVRPEGDGFVIVALVPPDFLDPPVGEQD